MDAGSEHAHTIGVLAMQGAFREHARAFTELGCDVREVRRSAELAGLDGIAIPGGESTAIRKLLAKSDLYDALGNALRNGLPAFGTCAGLIVLAHAPADGAPPSYGVLDVEIERNGFGRQLHSFETVVEIAGAGAVPGVFIRAPRIESLGAGVEAIGTLADGEVVAVRQGVLFGATFHPELTADRTLHRMFLATCVEHRRVEGKSHVRA